jgi:hypothetical protein
VLVIIDAPYLYGSLASEQIVTREVIIECIEGERDILKALETTSIACTPVLKYFRTGIASLARPDRRSNAIENEKHSTAIFNRIDIYRD